MLWLAPNLAGVACMRYLCGKSPKPAKFPIQISNYYDNSSYHSSNIEMLNLGS